MSLYQVGLLGKVTPAIVARVTRSFEELAVPLGLAGQIGVTHAKDHYDPKNDFASVALYFGGLGLHPDEDGLKKLMHDGTPVLPVVPDLKQFSKMVPPCLHAINGLELDSTDDTYARPVAMAMEVLGLLPRQRRLFVSYRRDEATEAALQLFEHLSGLQFDVFLDTHGVPPGEDFQEVLWHRLSDADVLVMLDTQQYFESRWTTQEFGRALAKSLVPLRLGWPGVIPAPRSLAGESLQFSTADFKPGGKRLTKSALVRAGLAIERARSRGIAVRSAEMNGAVIRAARQINGKFLALGPKRTIVIELFSGHKVLIYPSVGVPTAEHLHEASLLNSSGDSRAVVFDDIGVGRKWQDHLEWLGGQITTARFLRKARAAWDLAAWADDK